MAKQTLPRHRIRGVAAGLIISLAVVGCGSASAPPRSAPAVPARAVAPVEGSPEQTAIELGRATLDSAYRVAPIEGSPEAAAIELGR
ncbi:MAG TPA: hypothetical protein DCK98_00060 [Chloroflexi bacterium]|jgi:hypothetical protein|nr:hypothetical protein [Chloroflexota bacterium]HAL28113.1 hypothetical protein [Chloroflexota bacterium]